MNRLRTTAIAAALMLASPYVIGQTAPAAPTPPAPTPQQKGAAAAYQNPAAEKTQAEKSKEAMSAAEKSKATPKAAKPNVKDPETFNRAQSLSKSGTNPDEAKANVAKSKASGQRNKMPNVKDMTPEERAAVRKQMQEQSKP